MLYHCFGVCFNSTVNGEAKMSGTIAAGLDCIVAVSKLKKSGGILWL